MPYSLTHFGAVPLPDRMSEDGLDTGNISGTLVLSIGGAFDRLGAARALPPVNVISHAGLYATSGSVFWVDHAGNQIVDHAGNRMLVATEDGWLRAQVDLLRGMHGKRDRLYRRRDNDGALQWVNARLVSVQEQKTIEDAGVTAELRSTFETAMSAWRSSSLSVATGTLVSGGNVALLVSNDGNAPVNDGLLVVTASGAISSVTITSPEAGVSVTWTGTLAAGQSLVIDSGARTVRRSGASVYSGFVLNAAHTARGWFPLAEGITIFRVAVDGPGTVNFQHYDQFI